MNRRMQWIAGAIAVAVVVGSAPASDAQNATTGTIGGVVRDAQQGVLPGAAVVAVHAPTGTRYEAFARADGRFDLLNVQVGPYDLEVAMSGFGTRSLSGVVVTLGEATEAPITLQLAALTETVEVVGEASAVFSPSRSGTTAGVATGVIETLPTLERSLQDFARVNPFFVKTSQNAESESFLSVAGRNGRYNNIQIDGAVNNDLFGLARQGTPGGQANTQPISLDAVSELQLVVAPYDVRQSGFSGGGINVITRSGSNTFSGTGYLYSRQPRAVRAGARTVLQLQLLAHQRPAAGGRVLGVPDRLLRRRPVAGARRPVADLRPAPGRAHLPGPADRQPAGGAVVRAGHGRRARNAQLVAADRVQLRPESQPGRPATGARRPRAFPRAHAVRLAVQSVLEHRERVPAHPRVLRPGQPDSVLGRSARPADRYRLGVDQRDQPGRSRLPLSAAPAGQPGLRPGSGVLQPDRQRRAALLAVVARHRLPQPQPRRERRRAGRASDLRAAAPGLQQRRPADEHRRG